MSSPQSVISRIETVPETCALMPVGLFKAAIKGNIILLPEEQTENEVSIVINQSELQYPTDQSELYSVTCSGDTVLHLLVTYRHNDLALNIFKNDRSVLITQNMMLETPLHCAAKVGNNDIITSLISICPFTVMDALRKTNKNGDTALHIAAKHGYKDVGHELMMLDRDRELAYNVNKKMLSPLNIAIVEENFDMVKEMLDVEPNLAYIPFSDGMFPVHVAVRMGQKELVMHFKREYPDYAELLDPRGRNVLHIAAEEGQKDIFPDLLEGTSESVMLAKDYKENNLLHIAAMKGDTLIMRDIWEKNQDQDRQTNNKGLTPINLFVRQLRATTEIDDSQVSTIDRDRLSSEWFDNVMQLSVPNQSERTEVIGSPNLSERTEVIGSPNQSKRTEVIGLSSALVITVTFAASMTIPGGYKQDEGTPILARNYMFRAFIMANTLAFIFGFLSLYQLFEIPRELTFLSATDFFMLAANNVIVAFGLGLYLTLSSDCLPIAISILVITTLTSIANMHATSNNWKTLLAAYPGTFLLIFGLAKL